MLLSMVNIVPIHHHVALLVTSLLELYIGNGGGGQLAEGDMLEPSMSCSIANRVYIYMHIVLLSYMVNSHLSSVIWDWV